MPCSAKDSQPEGVRISGDTCAILRYPEVRSQHKTRTEYVPWRHQNGLSAQLWALGSEPMPAVSMNSLTDLSGWVWMKLLGSPWEWERCTSTHTRGVNKYLSIYPTHPIHPSIYIVIYMAAIMKYLWKQHARVITPTERPFRQELPRLTWSFGALQRPLSCDEWIEAPRQLYPKITCQNWGLEHKLHLWINLSSDLKPLLVEGSLSTTSQIPKTFPVVQGIASLFAGQSRGLSERQAPEF